MILAVESDAEGRKALDGADETLAGSYPHLDDTQRDQLSKHFLGYVTWRGIVHEFGLPESCLIERVSASPTPGESASPR